MRRVILATVSTVAVLVLLLGFKTAPAHGTRRSALGPTTTPRTTAAAPPAGGRTSKAAAPSGAAKTVSGDAVDTPFGPVQVQITVAARRITAAQALQMPQSGGRSGEISAYAEPVLVQETLRAQSANIDVVSGASYTSAGWAQSLQSALARAGL